MMAHDGHHPQGVGFTLIEMTVAISILVVITTIVYTSFAAVTDATQQARASAEQMRLRQYLLRNLSANFSTVYVDPLYLYEQYLFAGKSESGSGGASDSIEFCSTAPLMGGISPPGFLKRVSYMGTTDPDSGFSLETSQSADDESRPSLYLEAVESPLTSSVTEVEDGEAAEAAETQGYDSPTWSLPIRSLDFSFFDGTEWVEEWDSLATGRLPWSVRVRINFELTPEERESGEYVDGDENPDFEMCFSLPISSGVLSDASQWEQVLIASSAYYPGLEAASPAEQPVSTAPGSTTPGGKPGATPGGKPGTTPGGTTPGGGTKP